MKHEKEWQTCDRCGEEIEKHKIWYDRIFPYLRTVNLKLERAIIDGIVKE